MTNVHQWFTEYAKSHKHPTNKLLHYFCIPIIMMSLFGLLWSIPTHDFVNQLFPAGQIGNGYNIINVCTIFGVFCVLFYVRLSPVLSVAMILEAIILMSLNYFIAILGLPLLTISISLFILSWVIQIYGHKIEGAKPSFANDLVFFLIGPLWIMGKLYSKLGIKY